MFLRISHPRVNKTFLCLFVYCCCFIGRHTSQTHKSCLILCDSMDCSPPGSSVHGIFQARILEWVAISCSRGSSSPRDWTCVSCRKALLIYKSAVFLPIRWAHFKPMTVVISWVQWQNLSSDFMYMSFVIVSFVFGYIFKVDSDKLK